MERLMKKVFRLPPLQKDILDNTEWADFGYINDSDFIRRCIDEKLIELGLLKRNIRGMR